MTAKPVLPELLAQALGWKLKRVNATADELTRSLPLVGLRLHRNSTGQLAILSPTDGNGPAARTLDSLTLDNRGLAGVEAEMPAIAIDRGLPRSEVKDAAKRIALGRLLRQGVLTAAQPAILPSPAVDFALDF